MSDFDKDAERKRLREQYERDQAKREATEQMSELLLQGATMTNAHCSDCGDPIFRYDGQEFCATCERAVDRSNEAQDDAEETDLKMADPSQDTRVSFGTDSTDGAETESSGTTSPETGTDPTQDVSGTDESGLDQVQGRAVDTDLQPAGSRGESAQRPTTDRSDDTPLETTRASLERQLVRLTQQAESADDPRDAEAFLSAARTAAETLAALR